MLDQDGPGLLSKKQRAYLRGEHTPNNEATMRHRIRQRIQNAMLDFSLIYLRLPEEDRELIFSNENTDPDDEMDLWNGAIYTLAFLYERLTRENAYQNFEYSLQAAILTVLDQPGMARHEDLDVLGNVMVDIDTSRVVDLGPVGKKISREGLFSLNDEELDAIEYLVNSKSDEELHPEFKEDLLADVEMVRAMDDEEKAEMRAINEMISEKLNDAFEEVAAMDEEEKEKLREKLPDDEEL